MMRNSLKRITKAGIFSLLFMGLLMVSCKSDNNEEALALTRADTIVLPAKGFGSFAETFYSEKNENVYKLMPSEGYGKEIIFFKPDTPERYNSYKFDSIRNLDPDKYICANATETHGNKALVSFLNEWEFYTIRSDGEILDTLQISDKRENRNEYKMHWFLNMQRIPGKHDQYFLRAHKDVDRKGFNHRSKKQRINVMEGTGIGVIADISDTSVNIKREVGRYPETLFTDRKFKHVWPEFAINDKRELVYYFKEIDSLFVTDIETNKTNIYSMDVFEKSKDNQFDACFLNVFYDPYRNYIYLTYLPPCNKKDDEGLLINRSKRPWELVVIDEKFRVKGKLSFPDVYSKHRMMIGERGIYIRNDKLTKANSEGSVHVLYKFK